MQRSRLGTKMYGSGSKVLNPYSSVQDSVHFASILVVHNYSTTLETQLPQFLILAESYRPYGCFCCPPQKPLLLLMMPDVAKSSGLGKTGAGELL